MTVIFTTLKKGKELSQSDKGCRKQRSFIGTKKLQIKSLEKRALKFLGNEFLFKNNYKLTSINFSAENKDQDFQLLDDADETFQNLQTYCKSTK